MEFEEKEEQKLDLFVLLDGFLKEAKRRIVLLLVLVLLGGCAMAARQYMTFSQLHSFSVFYSPGGKPLVFQHQQL